MLPDVIIMFFRKNLQVVRALILIVAIFDEGDTMAAAVDGSIRQCVFQKQ